MTGYVGRRDGERPKLTLQDQERFLKRKEAVDKKREEMLIQMGVDPSRKRTPKRKRPKLSKQDQDRFLEQKQKSDKMRDELIKLKEAGYFDKQPDDKE